MAAQNIPKSWATNVPSSFSLTRATGIQKPTCGSRTAPIECHGSSVGRGAPTPPQGAITFFPRGGEVAGPAGRVAEDLGAEGVELGVLGLQPEDVQRGVVALQRAGRRAQAAELDVGGKFAHQSLSSQPS